MVVVEAVHDSPRDAQYLARTDLSLFSADRPGQYALKTVDRLLVTVMAVRSGHSGCGWDVEFEDPFCVSSFYLQILTKLEVAGLGLESGTP